MLKDKKKKIFMIPLIIVLLIVLLGVIAIIIYPKWLTQPVTNISKVNISSEFLDLEITDQKMMSKLYNLCRNTKIKNLEFDTSERNANMSDCFSIKFIYKNNSSDIIDCNNLLIKAEQEQVFTEVKECLEAHEKDFNKIINLRKSDKSTYKEGISGSISLTEYSLNTNNSKLKEQCLSLMKKTKISDITFGQGYVSFLYEENQEHVTDIIYFDDDDVKEKDLLWKVVKKIKPFYYMRYMMH